MSARLALLLLITPVMLIASVYAQMEPLPAASGGGNADDLADQALSLASSDLEELANADALVPAMTQEVTTVERREASIATSPAAIWVITDEMIRRSPHRRLPDLLRMAPGVIVQRASSDIWHVGVRGAVTRFNPSLLVQIDGRSVWTPLFSGVYWDVQDLLLEDIDRIEIIRGPGAATWGSNAVDGIINIITKDARDTQGLLLQAGAGTEERAFTAMRYGTQLGPSSWVRVYAKAFDRDEGRNPLGDEHDDWRQMRGGFRADFHYDELTHLTVQGDLYQGEHGLEEFAAGLTPPFVVHRVLDNAVHGGNLLMRWSSGVAESGLHTFHVYYDRADRHNPAFTYRRQTIDVDWQYQHLLGLHNIVLGANYRLHWDRVGADGFALSFLDPDRAFDIASVFVQDTFPLVEDRLYATVGTKVEYHDFAGVEVQPTARLRYQLSEDAMLWSGISRAAQTPSRAADAIRLKLPPTTTVPSPVFPEIRGHAGIDSQHLTAYEAGFRSQLSDAWFVDIAVYLHDYEDVIGFRTLPPEPIPVGFVVPLLGANNVRGEAYGFELGTSYRWSESLHTYVAYSFGRFDLRPASALSVVDELTHPRNVLYTQLNWDVCDSLKVDLVGRYSDVVRFGDVPPYFVMDARVEWNVMPDIDLIVAATDLLDRSHPEAASSREVRNATTEVERGIYAMVRWEPGRTLRRLEERRRQRGE